MANVLVRRDQFNITPQGVVHKPTNAAFTPHPATHIPGITRLGQLGSKHPHGNGFRPEDVQRMMWELWQTIYNLQPETVRNGRVEKNRLDLIGRGSQIQIDRGLTSELNEQIERSP